MKKASLAFIGLGSNLNNPALQIESAIEALSTAPEIDDVICAPWYQSLAIGPGDQPDYINTVAQFKTSLDPNSLLNYLQSIENKQGRQRHIRWGARTLDLDLLLYDQQTIATENLIVPHPEIKNRAFVLLPLYDLSPSLIFPNGERLADLVNRCDKIGLQKIENTENNKFID